MSFDESIFCPYRPISIVLLAVVAFCTGGCGSERGSGGSGTSTGGPSYDTGIGSTGGTGDVDSGRDTDVTGSAEVDGTNDATEPDGGGTDGCSDVACDDGEMCVEGECRNLGTYQCESAEELGTLTPGGSGGLTASGSFEGDLLDGLETSCATSEAAPEQVYEFRVAGDSQIDVESTFEGEFDAKVEFRRGDCLEPAGGEHEVCLDSDRSFHAPGGTTWYLVVEQDVGRGGSFEIELSARETCSAGGLGEYTCDGGDRVLCQESGGEIRGERFTCAGGCEGSRCAGDSCSNSIVVTGSNGGVFEGELDAYEPKWNFGKNATCGVNGTSVDSAGNEVVFEIPSVEAGDTIEVDTSSDQHDNLVYITRDCFSSVGQFTCVDTADSEVFSHEAESDGTYFVIVDKFSRSSGPFRYELEIR